MASSLAPRNDVKGDVGCFPPYYGEMRSIISINGVLTEESNARISPRDSGILRGYGVFDFFLTYQGGKPFHLKDHIQRLFRSAEIIHLHIPYSQDLVTAWVRETLKANDDEKEKMIRIVVTGGVGKDSVSPSIDHPTVIVFADPHTPNPNSCYTDGVGVVTSNHTRYLPRAKSINYLAGVIGIRDARSQGCVEVVYYDEKQVFEGATSNIFALIDGELCTPATNILPGLTRAVLLKHVNLPCKIHEKDFSIEQLRRSTEVFITAANKEVMPVVLIDGISVGQGRVGEITKQIMSSFREYTRSLTWIE